MGIVPFSIVMAGLVSPTRAGLILLVLGGAMDRWFPGLGTLVKLIQLWADKLN